MRVKKMLTLLVLLFTAMILLNAIYLAMALHRGSALAEHSEVFQQYPSNARNSLLVIGDSTAVGTGAQQPEDSVAGRLGKSLPLPGTLLLYAFALCSESVNFAFFAGGRFLPFRGDPTFSLEARRSTEARRH